MASKNRQHVWRAPWLYFAALILVALAYGLASFMLYEFGVSWWALPIIVLLIHYGTGLKDVPESKLIGVYFIGIPTIMWSAGPILLPLLLFRESRVSFETFQREFPGDPEDLFLGDDKDLEGEKKLPDGKKRPLRIIFGNPSKTGTYLLEKTGVTLSSADMLDADKDPLNVQVTPDYVNFFAQYRVVDIFNTTRNLTSKTKDGEIDYRTEIEKQLEDAGTRHLLAILSKIPLAVVKLNLDKINDEFAERVIAEVGSWGVQIIKIDLKLISLSHSLNRSIQDASAARADATKTVITAEATRLKRIKEGEGEGKYQEALLTGQGEGLKKKAAALGLKGADILAGDVATEIARGGNTIIAGADGFKEIAAMAAAFSARKKP